MTGIKALLAATLMCVASATFAGGFVASDDGLPRHIGPFTLGMSMTDFSKATGVTPEACPICIQGEHFATLDKDQLRRFAGFRADAQAIDLFFYQDQLYHIAVVPDTTDIGMATDQYSQRFGSRGRMIDQGNGMAQLKWEDQRTLLTMNFRPQENDVFSVNYYDGPLKQQRDRSEALIFENTANLDM